MFLTDGKLMSCKLRQWQEQNLLSDEKLKVQFKQEFHSWKHTRQLSISQGKGKDLVLSQSFRRPDSQLPGPTPAHADMEDQLYGLILDLRVQHLLCTLAICLQMAIEFDPTFLGVAGQATINSWLLSDRLEFHSSDQ